jgi:heme exporter protein D
MRDWGCSSLDLTKSWVQSLLQKMEEEQEEEEKRRRRGRQSQYPE